MSLATIAAFGYGIVAIAGGAMGYRQAGSKMSLISGLISGILLIVAALAELQGQTWGSVLALIVTIALIVVFAMRLSKTRRFMPAGLMIVLGVVALIAMAVPI